MAKIQAVLYLRSSKDRKDVSPAAQRRELTDLAKERGCLIVDEFVDVVRSGKSEFRPGFQSMLRGLAAKDRSWSTILIYDTSRLARNQYVAHFFRHECKRRNVEVVFAATPEMDGIAGIILPAILHAHDEVHSYMSKEKGLAGMAENVRSGFRAGGSAPRGYQLKKIPTGAVRDGEPVTKSVLELDPEEGDKVAAYLLARAGGIARAAAAESAGLAKVSGSTLVCMEWNALAYAGHTVWNVHNERDPAGGYVGGMKRKPRKEWMIQRDTHPAMITEEQAEALLQALENSKHGTQARQRARTSECLLGGILFTPSGEKWWGLGGDYRWKGAIEGDIRQRSIKCHLLDTAVMDQVLGDIQTPQFAEKITAAARAKVKAQCEPESLAQLEATLTALTEKISRTMDLAAELSDPAPALRKIEDLERSRADLVREVKELQDASDTARAMAQVSVDDVARIMRDVAADLLDGQVSDVRSLLTSIIEKVVIDPHTLAAALHYRGIPASGVKVASPRVHALNTAARNVPSVVVDLKLRYRLPARRNGLNA